MNFPTDLNSIQDSIRQIDPKKYADTRDFVDGQVSCLSPYISRGVISVNDVKKEILKNHGAKDAGKFLQELAWREYWQRVWQSKGGQIFQDIKQPQQLVDHHQMVKSISDASTGIEAVDAHIKLMYSDGYMHNHVRMYVASMACNIARAHWLKPAKWMYHHLLDGDIASNHLSWQWVAGSFSNKKYFCNQENINRFTKLLQRESFLDISYPELEHMAVPKQLQEKDATELSTVLPVTQMPQINEKMPVLIYNSYNLDPSWRRSEDANRILLLEPAHFEKYPVSGKVIDFILSLSTNIEGIKLFCGEMNELMAAYPDAKIIYKEHPAFEYAHGVKDSRDWMFPQVEGYYPSFFPYWKKCEKHLSS